MNNYKLEGVFKKQLNVIYYYNSILKGHQFN